MYGFVVIGGPWVQTIIYKKGLLYTVPVGAFLVVVYPGDILAQATSLHLSTGVVFKTHPPSTILLSFRVLGLAWRLRLEMGGCINPVTSGGISTLGGLPLGSLPGRIYSFGNFTWVGHGRVHSCGYHFRSEGRLSGGYNPQSTKAGTRDSANAGWSMPPH